MARQSLRERQRQDARRALRFSDTHRRERRRRQSRRSTRTLECRAGLDTPSSSGSPPPRVRVIRESRGRDGEPASSELEPASSALTDRRGTGDCAASARSTRIVARVPPPAGSTVRDAAGGAPRSCTVINVTRVPPPAGSTVRDAAGGARRITVINVTVTVGVPPPAGSTRIAAGGARRITVIDVTVTVRVPPPAGSTRIAAGGARRVTVIDVTVTVSARSTRIAAPSASLADGS